jgi:hypothetical protein
MKTVTYFSITIANKTGQGAKLLAAIEAAGINMTAAWGYPMKGSKSIVDVVPEDAKAFAKLAKQHKLAVEKRLAIYHDGADKVGAVREIMQKLGDAKVNVRAIQAICGGAGRYGALLQFDDKDLSKAKKVLGAK